MTGSLTAGVGSHVDPGNSVGTLTASALALTPGAALDYEFSATSNDFIKVTGSNGLTINGGQFNLLQEGSSTPFSALGTYHLLNYVGTLQGTGPSSLAVLDPQPGFRYAFSNNTTLHDIDLTIAVAPEPSSLTMLAFGGLLFGGIASRRLKSRAENKESSDRKRD